MTLPETFRDARVLVVSPMSGGSLPISSHVVEALEELGVTVRHADMSFLVPPSAWESAASDASISSTFARAAASPPSLVNTASACSLRRDSTR